MTERASTRTDTKRARPRRPDLATVYTINPDGSRNFLHPADVKGRWQVRKNLFYTVLIILYAALPWIQLNERPLVHIDLPGRAAYVFGQSFTNQDFYLVFFLATGFGFALFVLSSLWGRIWCGYACPQTVFMEGVFRRIERWLEGPRLIRIRRNLGPWGLDKAWRKIVKQAVFLGLSFLIAHVFLAYFLPARELLEVVRSHPREHLSAFFWTMLWTGILYFNYSWFREQTCLIVCPYGRLQSTLIDPDTVIIGYDAQRGEPRMKGIDEGGDCIDCYRCVEVCPTGVDIRNGLQMECIGCANCVDACDDVMGRIGKPRGLVRYDSQRGFELDRRRFLWPRFWIYVALGGVGIAAFAFMTSIRATFEAKAIRSRGMPYVMEEDRIRNLYTLHLQNKSTDIQTYFVTAGVDEVPGGATLQFIVPQPRIELPGLADVQIPIFAYLPRSAYTGYFDFHFSVIDSLSGRERRIEVRFRGP